MTRFLTKENYPNHVWDTVEKRWIRKGEIRPAIGGRPAGARRTWRCEPEPLQEPDRNLAWRDNLLKRYPAEFEHGYLSGFTGELQRPCDPAGYPEGVHGWPLERRNAWFAGWNLGNSETDNGDG